MGTVCFAGRRTVAQLGTPSLILFLGVWGVATDILPPSEKFVAGAHQKEI